MIIINLYEHHQLIHEEAHVVHGGGMFADARQGAKAKH